MTTSPAQEWLSQMPSRALLSEQLRVTGRFVIQEVRAGHFPPGFARSIMQALRQPGKLLGSPVMGGALLGTRNLRGWALPLLLAAAAASGAETEVLSDLSPSFWRRACAVAAASEYLGAALDLIDDVQDGDSPFVQQLGMPIALNIGIALLELAPLALRRARAAGWPDSLALAAQEALHANVLTSLGGQYMDLRFEQSSAVSEAQVIEMTEKKSGALLALICQLGAMAGTSNQQAHPSGYFEAISQFGWHLGVWFQLLNDLHDAELAQAQPAKSDRQRHKKTLPLLLEQRGMIENTDNSIQAQSLNAQAALSYTYVMAETFRLRAQKALQALEEQFGQHSLLWPLTLPTWEES
ncbi:MAG TPA: polyprenyl synthetase family protein [Ktedonobacterales bacterium]|nr:polyprenyl synthetase family protein [Ktedonobacterales bacterium]